MNKHAGSFNPIQPQIAPTRETITGSINLLANCIKLKYVNFYACNVITGNIENMFINIDRLSSVKFVYVKRVGNNEEDNWNYTTTNISGNINVFANKYDLREVLFYSYTNINGQLKDLKNLKKLYYCHFRLTSVIGSKTDLYNNGAGVTHFNV